MKIIGIVGFIGSGKDTVANLFVDKASCIHDSFASPLKDLCATVFGWPRHLIDGDTVESRDFRETADIFWSKKTGIPNFTPRLALQLIGTEVMREHFHTDIWIDSLEYRLRANGESKCIVVSDARFRNELDLVKSLGGHIIWVQRGELPEWHETASLAHENVISRKIMKTQYKDIHESEWNWVGYPVDYVIKNNGSLDDLERNVLHVQSNMFKSPLQLV